jgi:hypothetical protein
MGAVRLHGWGRWRPGGSSQPWKSQGQRGAHRAWGEAPWEKPELAGRGAVICCRVRARAWGREMPWRQQRRGELEWGGGSVARGWRQPAREEAG